VRHGSPKKIQYFRIAKGNMDPQQEISVEVCTAPDEIRQCVQLQRRIWNDAEEDLIPSSLFVVANKIGGQVLLAKAGEHPAGFALAFPAFHGETRYLHSHIVGVASEYQNRGVGRQIKLKQRELALTAGIELLEWTFDPLEVRNAYFNVVRLGAVIRSFYPNLYGVTASPLHGGLPTDRFVAEWHLSSPRVESALAGKRPTNAADAIKIVVPADLAEWKKVGSPRAAEFQAHLRTQFQTRFAQGFVVTGFTMDGKDGIYLLETGANALSA
jgi:predicted GNAT superfamily acetyltransferase